MLSETSGRLETSIESLGTRRVYKPTEWIKHRSRDPKVDIANIHARDQGNFKPSTYQLWFKLYERWTATNLETKITKSKIAHINNCALQMESDVQKLQVTLGWNAVVPNRIDNFCNSTQASTGLRMPLMWFAGGNKQWDVTSTCKACTDWAHFNGISQSCACQGLQVSMVHSPLNMASWKIPLWALCT